MAKKTPPKNRLEEALAVVVRNKRLDLNRELTELEHDTKRAVSRIASLLLELPEELRGNIGFMEAPADLRAGELAKAVKAYERTLVGEAVKRAKAQRRGERWKKRAAEIYGVRRTTFNDLLRRDLLRRYNPEEFS